MDPRKRPEQEHIHSEKIDGNIQDSHQKPASVIINMRVEDQEKEWNGIISELYKWSRNQCRSGSQKIY